MVQYVNDIVVTITLELYSHSLLGTVNADLSFVIQIRDAVENDICSYFLTKTRSS